MTKKIISLGLAAFIIIGIVLSVINFTSKTAKAGGYIVKYGTYVNPGDEETCPGKEANCCVIYYIE